MVWASAGRQLRRQPPSAVEVLRCERRAQRRAQVAPGLEQSRRVGEPAVLVVQARGVAGAAAGLEELGLGLPVACELGRDLQRGATGCRPGGSLGPRPALGTWGSVVPLSALGAFGAFPSTLPGWSRRPARRLGGAARALGGAELATGTAGGRPPRRRCPPARAHPPPSTPGRLGRAPRCTPARASWLPRSRMAAPRRRVEGSPRRCPETRPLARVERRANHLPSPARPASRPLRPPRPPVEGSPRWCRETRWPRPAER